MPNIDDIARWLGPKKKAVQNAGEIIYEPDDDKKVEPVSMNVKDMPKATVFQVRNHVGSLTDSSSARNSVPSNSKRASLGSTYPTNGS